MTRWDRAYVGLGAGVIKTRNAISFELPTWFAFERTSVAFGGEIGRRWQKGRLVAGLELRGILTRSSTVRFPPEPDFILYRSGNVTVRVNGQLGYDFGPAMVYATAGPQFMKVHNIGYCITYACSWSDYRTAMNYGAGYVMRLSDDLSFDVQVTTARFNPVPGDTSNHARLTDELVSLQLGF